MIAIPTTSPIYRAHEIPYRARDAPPAMTSAPIPIQRLKESRDLQYEYTATPIKAMLPGIVKKNEKTRTLSGIPAPATGIGLAKAAALSVTSSTATSNPAKMNIGLRVHPCPAHRRTWLIEQH